MDEWASLGAVDVRYAFSREPERSAGCKYVQERMLRDRQDIFDLWDRGGKVFLCGGPGMVEGVRTAAKEMVSQRAKEQGLDGTEERAEKWLKEMRNERIVVDVFA